MSITHNHLNTRLLANINYDLWPPLADIIGLTELLETDKLITPAEQQAFLQELQRAARKIIALADARLTGQTDHSATNSNDTSSSKDKTKPNTSTEPLHILLVEDDLAAQIVGRNNIEELGCLVDVVNSSELALKKVQQQKFDLIFLDIGLPDLNGIHTAEKIRKKNNKNQDSPIVTLTAYANSDEKKWCQKVGVNKIILKPLTKKVAAEIIDQLRNNELKPMNLQQQKILNTKKIIDITGYVERIGCKLEIIEDMLTEFMLTLPNDKTNIINAYKQQNQQILTSLIHRMHGATVYVPTPKLRVALEAMETQLNQNTDEIDANLFKIVINELDAVAAAYKDYKK